MILQIHRTIKLPPQTFRNYSYTPNVGVTIMLKKQRVYFQGDYFFNNGVLYVFFMPDNKKHTLHNHQS